jgi:hypothetical protein
MTGRILNRRELRKPAEGADQAVEVAAAAAAAPAKKPRAKAPAAPRAKKPRKPKEAPRLRARWAVFDGSMKQVAVFDYNQRTRPARLTRRATPSRPATMARQRSPWGPR